MNRATAPQADPATLPRAVLLFAHPDDETLAPAGPLPRFRKAPEYDFANPAPTPPVFYDGFPCGMSSQGFGEFAREAERALQQEALAGCR
jgi:hypothetical protein